MYVKNLFLSLNGIIWFFLKKQPQSVTFMNDPRIKSICLIFEHIIFLNIYIFFFSFFFYFTHLKLLFSINKNVLNLHFL